MGLTLSAFSFVHAARRDFKGTIAAVNLTDPMQEERYDLAVIEVQDGVGEAKIFVVNLDTHIKDPMWRDAYVGYLHKGIRVDIEYETPREGNLIARRVLVKAE